MLLSGLPLACLVHPGVRAAGQPHDGHHHQPRHQGRGQGRDDAHQDGAHSGAQARRLLHAVRGPDEAGQSLTTTDPGPGHHLALVVTEGGRHLETVKSLLEY